MRLLIAAAFLLVTSPGLGQITLSDSTTVHRCKPGPWGELEYYYLHLEAPDHITELITAPSSRTIWHFPGKSLDEIDAILTTASIPQEDRVRIYEASNIEKVEPPYRLFPPDEVVASLSPLGRKILYQHLRPWSENRFHHQPVIIESGDVREWFEDSGLSGELITLIQRLTYPLGNSLAFSDIPLVLSRIETASEEQTFLRAITRNRSLVLRMAISPESDFATLKDYWSAGKKGKDIMSFFDSISFTPDVEKVDVIHLLPPTPRKYLNTFPSLSLAMEGQFPGHFWTSLNFTRHNPLPDFDSDDYSIAYIKKFFERIQPPFRFGDLVIVVDPEKRAIIHSCIYIADDIVYTKNGRSPMRPFMFMKLNDLINRVSVTATDPAIEVWRNPNR